MITIKSKSANYGINIPTAPEEISKEKLNKLTENFKLPQYYCVVALRYRITLFELCMNSRGKGRKQLVSVVPILAKKNDKELPFAEVGDRILIDGSEIERGSHLNINTCITPDKISNYILNDDELNKASINHSLTGKEDDTIYCLEFKVIPINSVKGSIIGNVDDPFLNKIDEEK